jgi:hypothetical protein
MKVAHRLIEKALASPLRYEILPAKAGSGPCP